MLLRSARDAVANTHSRSRQRRDIESLSPAHRPHPFAFTTKLAPE